MDILQKLRSANIARHLEWTGKGKEPINLSYRGNELAGETGEACNVIKKLERERLGIVGSRASTPMLADELADIIICCDLIAMDTNIDLASAVLEKFNLTSAKYGLKTKM